ncbi:MAG: hypothetical protein ABR529_04505 [Actinomycetota bacterium]
MSSPLSSALAPATALLAARRMVPGAIAHAPASLWRVNVRGAPVPAVLGGPLAAGTAVGLSLVAAGAGRAPARRVAAVTGGLVLVTAVGGYVDDLRGDEPARGFRGHLGALASGRITGGVVKMAAGGLGGLAAGAALEGPRGAAGIGTIVALSANLVNLLDRAPGRAGKASALAATSLIMAGDRSWSGSGAVLLGAVMGCLPADLGERAMLGDAGADPLGAAVGLGLALATRGRSRGVAIGALGVLNAASERWSFSEVIARHAWLRRLDRLGRA